jgi:hypothetical protein
LSLELQVLADGEPSEDAAAFWHVAQACGGASVGRLPGDVGALDVNRS